MHNNTLKTLDGVDHRLSGAMENRAIAKKIIENRFVVGTLWKAPKLGLENVLDVFGMSGKERNHVRDPWRLEPQSPLTVPHQHLGPPIVNIIQMIKHREKRTRHWA
ncbi:hypothetical protein SUGI_1043500 [Cryptomeria japonica]|nr:hypothetical protein SUGI_1043500 [Cryptomeria japonica]